MMMREFDVLGASAFVMRGLDSRIHVLQLGICQRRTWMAGTSPAMTMHNSALSKNGNFRVRLSRNLPAVLVGKEDRDMDSSPSAFMKSFFAELPDLDELAPDALATEYVKYCYSRLDEVPSLVVPCPIVQHLPDGRQDVIVVRNYEEHACFRYDGFKSSIWITKTRYRKRLHWHSIKTKDMKYIQHWKHFDNFYFCPDLLGTWQMAAIGPATVDQEQLIL